MTFFFVAYHVKSNIMRGKNLFSSMVHLKMSPSYNTVYSYYVHSLTCFYHVWFFFRSFQLGLPTMLDNARRIRDGRVHNLVRFSMLRTIYNSTNKISLLYAYRKKKKQRKSVFYVRQMDRCVSLRNLNTVYNRLACYYNSV